MKINPCLFRPLEYPDRSVVWEVTKKCNLKCPHCCSNAGAISTELSCEEALRLLQIMIDNGVKELYFSGGEPLLWKPLTTVIKNALDNNILCCIATSGYVFDDKLLNDLFQLNISSFHISLDSYYAKDHDSFRGAEGAFDKAIDFIKKAKAGGHKVVTSTLIRRKTVSDLSELVTFIDGLGVDHATYNFFVPLGRGMNNSIDVFTPEEKQAVIDKINKISGTTINKVDCRRIVCSDDGFSDCPAGKSLLHVDAFGNVSPCSWVAKLWPDLLQPICDTLISQQQLELLNQRFYAITDPMCSDCKVTDCKRGCPVMAALNQNNIDPLCIINKRGR